MQKPNLYGIEIENLQGEKLNMSQFQNKVLLIVNTASKCGFTPQYKAMETLYQKYKSRGLEVLAFPSNDFGQQEPLNGNEIAEFCKLKFANTFPIFAKIKVKGADSHPLFKFLSKKELNGTGGIEPKWNFQKYLVNRNGEYEDYFLSITDPMSTRITNKIEKLLVQKS